MKRFRMSLRDLFKTLGITTGAAVITLIQEAIPNWHPDARVEIGISFVASLVIKYLATDEVKVAHKVIATHRKKE